MAEGGMGRKTDTTITTTTTTTTSSSRSVSTTSEIRNGKKITKKVTRVQDEVAAREGIEGSGRDVVEELADVGVGDDPDDHPR